MAGMYGKITGAEAFSDPQTSQIYNMPGFKKPFYQTLNAYRRFSEKGGEGDQLYDQYKVGYLGGTPQAMEDANLYRNYAKELFSSGSGGSANNFDLYTKTGDYLYGNLDRFTQGNRMAGTASMNDLRARLGSGTGGSSFSDKINADRITAGSMPAFMNTTNAIGRDYNTLANNNYRDIAIRLGLAQDDALGGYMDRVYERPLNVASTRLGMINANNSTFKNMVDAYKSNIGGWKTEEGSDLAKYGRVFDTWASSYGGGGMYGGGNSDPPGPNNGYPSPNQPQMQQGGGYNPYMPQQYGQMPQGGYPNYGNTGGQMAPAQNQAWMNAFNGTNLGDVSSGGGDFGGGGW